MTEDIVASIWSRRCAWSRAADRLKAGIVRARTAALLLGAAGAVLETAAATLFDGAPALRAWCAGTGAVLLAAATFVTARFLTVDAVRAWTRARSVSEALKTEVYKFRAGAHPYRSGEAVRLLQQEARKVQEAARDLEGHVVAAGLAAGPGAGFGKAGPPPCFDPEGYIAQRVRGQIDGYYLRKARLHAGRLALFRRTELALGLAATMLGAAAAYASGAAGEAGEPSGTLGTDIAAWVAVLTTLGGVVAAHVAASRYDFLVMSYCATARRLDDLVNDWRSRGAPADAENWSAFVQACEDAISVENEGWLAKWAERDPRP